MSSVARRLPAARSILSTLLLGVLSGCGSQVAPAESGNESRPGERLKRRGDEIVVAGQLYHTDTRVVLWNDPGGYDAYRPHRFFNPDVAAPKKQPSRVARFGTYRGSLPPKLAKRVKKQGWRLEDLQQAISQVVLHFDACGTSKRCFEVLHDERGLSCHFLLDLDGTIYQTLDLKERAWHAAQANDRSVGVEIANVGAYSDEKALSLWYSKDRKGTRITIPKAFQGGGLPPDFLGRPRRSEPISGTINGRKLIQYDYTKEQYEALKKLLITLCRVFPRIKARVPRQDDGRVLDRTFSSDEELAKFQGILGHHNVKPQKYDPGPAFDWEWILDSLRKAGIDS